MGNTELINKAEADKLAMKFHMLTIGLSLVEMFGTELRYELKDTKSRIAAKINESSIVCSETMERIMKTVKMDGEVAYVVTEDVIELIKVFSTKHPDKRAEILAGLKNNS